MKKVCALALFFIGLSSHSAMVGTDVVQQCSDEGRHLLEFYNGTKKLTASVSCTDGRGSSRVTPGDTKSCCTRVWVSALSIGDRGGHFYGRCNKKTEKTRVHLKGNFLRTWVDVYCESR